MGAALYHGDAFLREHPGVLAHGHPLDHFVQAVHGGGEGQPARRRLDQGLGGHAAGEGAITPEPAVLGQGGAPAEPGPGPGGGQAGGPATDHDEVELLSPHVPGTRSRDDPFPGMLPRGDGFPSTWPGRSSAGEGRLGRW